MKRKNNDYHKEMSKEVKIRSNAEMKKSPNYKKIYADIISMRFPDRMEEMAYYLEKKELSGLDIIMLNEKIFGISDKETKQFTQKHRSYDKSTIFQILDYQKEHKLNNSQIANHFKLSRNTIARWKRHFIG